MNDATEIDRARRLDAADPLAAFRDRFARPAGPGGSELTYLAGHSLGLQPLAAQDRVREELEDWARLGVNGHFTARRPWIDYHEHLREGLAELAGARPEEVVPMNSLTVNLHLMMASFYRPEPGRSKILIESGAFPSDRHAVASQLEWRGFDVGNTLIELAPPAGSDLLDEQEIEALLDERGHEVALVLWPGVQFRTGQSFDLVRIARAARRAGANVGIDVAHAIGNVPLDLHGSDADFAVWCTYKYLNAGPGAIGGCFVHERHARDARLPRLAGWWGHDAATRFEMRPGFKPMLGAAGWQVSNPAILAAAPLVASLEIFREARLSRLREKSIALNAFLESLLSDVAEVQVVTPRDPAARGNQMSLRLRDSRARGRRVFDALASRGIVCDWREPDVIRMAAVPLYNRFEDVARFVAALRRTLKDVAS
jgi:kynureninase